MARQRIGYLVHDLGDAAVARRVRMLRAAGAEVVLFGFARREPPSEVEGAPAVFLGRTRDGRLLHRLLAVVRTLPRIGRLLEDRDVLLARNLEMLALASAVRGTRRLVYECLDVHRTLTGTGPVSRSVRWLERRLLRGVDLLITSSPRFVTEHFARAMPAGTPIVIAENKVLALAGAIVAQPPPEIGSGRPWRIGWFGMLRCRRSFALLAGLAAALPGRVDIVIAGRPSTAEFPDWDDLVARAPGVRFAGSYDAADLPRLYGDVEFAWTIDYFEEGANSAWLLPNRLYEASSHGAVPIALADVETGAWLDRHHAGLLVSNPARDLATIFGSLDPPAYRRIWRAVAAIPRGDLVATRDDCVSLVAAILGWSGAEDGDTVDPPSAARNIERAMEIGDSR